MNRRERSLKRLDELADYYRDTGQVKAVLAFGSCGKELDRFDEYSDLDFLVVCEDAHQQTLLQNLM